MTRPLPLVVDTDPGIDDAMAILWAASEPDVRIAALTTVFGNVRTDQATRNALRLLEWAGVDAPVAEGARTPLVLPPFTPSAHVHGAEGFGPIPAEAPAGAPVAEGAADLIVRECAAGATLCPVGPLTNVAAALRRSPGLSGAEIVVMGGAVFVPGNITPHAEANIYHDPHAAAEVFASGAKVRLVGLDVTNGILMDRSDMARLAERAPRLGGRIAEMADFYIDFYESVGLSGCALHDPAAVIACLRPELFDWEETPLRVVTQGEEAGRTVAGGEGPPVLVARGCDAPRIREIWMEGIARLD
ncbi:inosine-uridine nucleoside N-ribohydrolase [Hasllibacter halocynthiae]|uniref:Inosine-uridine nucleoside N-ribohydrolase n=1 Tax=Hasllibacter halocynthiae TaxID=595589 RepID=A0A2T0X4A9_9RHOB|nr:nucleoside hydrolase [Hasllibacter halocynthiae]PRY93783.1 inosine-uridine nucleoside N-ribohydrolase [Hasllibacter halocynthiae]